MGVRECCTDSLASAPTTLSRGLDCASWSVDSAWLSGSGSAPASRPQSAKSSRPQSAASSRPQGVWQCPPEPAADPADSGFYSAPLPTRHSGKSHARQRPCSVPSGGRARTPRPRALEKQGWPYTGRKEVSLAGPGHAAARRDRKPRDDPSHPTTPRVSSTAAGRCGGWPSRQEQPECLLDRMWRLWAMPDGADGLEITIDSFMFILSKSDFFSGSLAGETARGYLEALTRSENAAFLVVKTRQRYSRGISYVQFAGALQEFSGILGITYAECVSKLVNAETAITRLKLLFRRSCSSARQDRMTVSDFSKFCERFQLFVERQFCHADIHLMLRKSSEKNKMDYEEFLSALAKIAGMLGIDWDIFCSALTVRASELGLFLARPLR